MQLIKLKMNYFEKNILSFSSLKSLSGGMANYTEINTASAGQHIVDYFDNKQVTHWADCKTSDDTPCNA